ncbi:MAG: superoxide dismutase [Holosporales bacterium]|jgi:Fe-Mn family superoxide dismutase|nr:superoxide dismutase [Holosporales bacterium]
MTNFKAQIPYGNTELFPILSQETIDFHYDKHHSGYANTLNSLIENTEYAEKTLEEIIIKSRGNDRKIFNNAAQLFNHDFYWKCLMASENRSFGQLKSIVKNQFGSFEEFLNQYISFANTMFGSGWSWLVLEREELSFVNTANAENPIGTNPKIICVIDLWEHAYYIDYRNDRASYITRLITECINWTFCESLI